MKLRFLLISKIMLKNIPITLSECIMQYEYIASDNTNYIFPDLSDFFRGYCKGIRKRIKKRNVYICEKRTD